MSAPTPIPGTITTPVSKPAVLIQVVLAGAQVFTGAAGAGDLLPKVAMAWIIIAIAVIQAGYGTYNQLVQVVPANAVAAVVDPKSGAVVAGPASPDANGTPVDVQAAA